MKLHRARFTVRRMMVAVAIVGVIVGGWIEIAKGRRRARFDELSQEYYLRMLNCSVITYSGPGGAHFEELVKAKEARNAKPLAYYAEMFRKYRSAARYPWLPVAPDPAEPQE